MITCNTYNIFLYASISMFSDLKCHCMAINRSLLCDKFLKGSTSSDLLDHMILKYSWYGQLKHKNPTPQRPHHWRWNLFHIWHTRWSSHRHCQPLVSRSTPDLPPAPGPRPPRPSPASTAARNARRYTTAPSYTLSLNRCCNRYSRQYKLQLPHFQTYWSRFNTYSKKTFSHPKTISVLGTEMKCLEARTWVIQN